MAAGSGETRWSFIHIFALKRQDGPQEILFNFYKTIANIQRKFPDLYSKGTKKNA
jgi:hypothetical protein